MKARFIISLEINTAAYSIIIRPKVEASQKRTQEKKNNSVYAHNSKLQGIGSQAKI